MYPLPSSKLGMQSCVSQKFAVELGGGVASVVGGAVPAPAQFTDTESAARLKVFASALGFGILLDATVVRSLLVPSLVSMFGDWNWWMPGWLAAVLRVPAHARGDVPSRPGEPERVSVS